MRMDKEQRRSVVLDGALKVAKETGLAGLTFENVAEACEVETSPATVRRYVRRISELQSAVLLRAKGTEIYKKLKSDAQRLGIA